MVRLLGTTNAGLNDFAATECQVSLLAEDRSSPWTLAVTLGQPSDGAFRAAFARPQFFGSYGDSFRGILEPGVIVPFPARWVDVPVECSVPVRYVRIRITKFWAAGGGLNEVQVYPVQQ